MFFGVWWNDSMPDPMEAISLNCMLEKLYYRVNKKSQKLGIELKFMKPCVVYTGSSSLCIRQEGSRQISEVWEGPDHRFTQTRSSAANTFTTPTPSHSPASFRGVKVSRTHILYRQDLQHLEFILKYSFVIWFRGRADTLADCRNERKEGKRKRVFLFFLWTVKRPQ